MPAKGFADQLEAFAAKAEAKTNRAVELAVQGLIEEASRPESAGGNMPVVSGRLRESIKVRVNGALVAEGAAAALSAARGVEAGAVVDVSWGEPGTRAPYAAEAEFGSVKVRAHFFARSAAERWSAIVEEAIRQAAAE